MRSQKAQQSTFCRGCAFFGGMKIGECLGVISEEIVAGNRDAIDWLLGKGFIRLKSPLETEFVRFDDLRTGKYANEFRNRLFKRDGYICQECGSKGKLQLHHKKKWSLFKEDRFDERNCLTLCIKCHIKKHPEIANLIKKAKYKK